MTSIWIVMGLDQLIWLPLQSIRFSVENLEGSGWAWSPYIHPDSVASVQSKDSEYLGKVRKYIFNFIYFPLNINVLLSRHFYDIFIKSSMTFSPIYDIYHCFITAKSYNGMKCFEKSRLIYLLNLLIS